MEKAADKIESAVSRLEGDAHRDAKKILDATRAFLQREDIKADEWGNAAGKRIVEITHWKGIYGQKDYS